MKKIREDELKAMLAAHLGGLLFWDNILSQIALKSDYEEYVEDQCVDNIKLAIVMAIFKIEEKESSDCSTQYRNVLTALHMHGSVVGSREIKQLMNISCKGKSAIIASTGIAFSAKVFTEKSISIGLSPVTMESWNFLINHFSLDDALEKNIANN